MVSHFEVLKDDYLQSVFVSISKSFMFKAVLVAICSTAVFTFSSQPMSVSVLSFVLLLSDF